MLLASAVPLITGVLSVLNVPSAGLVMIGALGAIVSIVTATVVESMLVFPAVSVALAVIRYVPSDQLLEGV